MSRRSVTTERAVDNKDEDEQHLRHQGRLWSQQREGCSVSHPDKEAPRSSVLISHVYFEILLLTYTN